MVRKPGLFRAGTTPGLAARLCILSWPTRDGSGGYGGRLRTGNRPAVIVDLHTAQGGGWYFFLLGISVKHRRSELLEVSLRIRRRHAGHDVSAIDVVTR